MTQLRKGAREPEDQTGRGGYVEKLLIKVKGLPGRLGYTGWVLGLGGLIRKSEGPGDMESWGAQEKR